MADHQEAARDRLRQAVNAGDADALQALLERDADAKANINEPIGHFGARPMTMTHDRAMLEVLLDFGADPNQKSHWNEGPWSPLDDTDEETARMLLLRGAKLSPHVCAAHGWLDELRKMLDDKPARVHQPGGDGKRPLHWAKDAATVDFLIGRLADVNARCQDHLSTPLQYLAKSRPEAALRLLHHGATPDIFTSAQLGQVQAIELELHFRPELVGQQIGADGYNRASTHTILRWIIGHYKLPYVVAREASQDEAADVLIHRAMPKHRFMSHAAAGELDRATPLADELRNMNRAEHAQLATVIFFGNAQAADTMIELGFDPAGGGVDGGSAVHAAAWMGDAERLVKLLADPRGNALLDTPDPTHGSPPLGWVCFGSHMRNARDGDYVRCVELLLSAGASRNAPGNDVGNSFADMAGPREDVKQALTD